MKRKMARIMAMVAKVQTWGRPRLVLDLAELRWRRAVSRVTPALPLAGLELLLTGP